MASLGRGHLGLKRITAVPRQAAIEAQAGVTSGVFQTLLTALSVTIVPRQPVFTPRHNRPAWQAPLVVANLLLTTLAVVAPFTPASASIPDRLQPVRSSTIAQPIGNLLETTLATPAASPFVQQQLENPPRPSRQPYQPSSYRNSYGAIAEVSGIPFIQTEWINPLQRVRVSALFQSAIRELEPWPFIQTEWPNPVRQIQRSQQNPLNLLENTLAVVQIQNPFKFSDWSVPLNHKPLQQFVALNLLESTLAPPVIVGDPFYYHGWVNPSRGIRPALQPQSYRNSYGDVAVLPGAPFIQTDWQNPGLRRYPIIQSAIRELEPWPFIQIEWPNPAVRLYRVQWHPYNLLENTLIVAPSPGPFSQMDWAMPVRPQHRPDGMALDLLVTTLEVVTPPGGDTVHLLMCMGCGL